MPTCLRTFQRLIRFGCLSLGVLSLFLTAPVLAAPFDCGQAACGLLTRGNNPHLVIGRVEAVATAAQMTAVFHWARSHGFWNSLPADAHGYRRHVALVSLAVPSRAGGRSVTVLMTREEYDAGPFKPGALVRYSPHDAAHDAITYKDPARQAYWKLVGCVAQLCAAGDAACIARYRGGVFARGSGAQLSLDSGKPVAHGVKIDPGTLLPKRTKHTES